MNWEIPFDFDEHQEEKESQNNITFLSYLWYIDFLNRIS